MRANKKQIVIAGFAGVGKTYLGNKYCNVKDLESSVYKYDYSKIKNPDHEKLKGDPTRIRNKNFPQNYISGIKQALKEYDIVAVWISRDMFKLYRQNGINFWLCYPTKASLKKYYIPRYIARGNSQRWIDGTLSYYDDIRKTAKTMKEKKIVLHNDQTLEDWLLKHNYKLIEK